jgi:hypothetical protein
VLGNVYYDKYSLKLNFGDGTSIDIDNVDNPQLGNTLEVGGGQSGKILKFNNLPTGDGGLDTGMVYRTSDGTLKIKI